MCLDFIAVVAKAVELKITERTILLVNREKDLVGIVLSRGQGECIGDLQAVRS
jgi:hypothetical protein